MTKIGAIASWFRAAATRFRWRDHLAATHLPSANTDWPKKLRALKSKNTIEHSVAAVYADANITTIFEALSASHMVVNISAAHVPAVCSATRRGDAKPYKNTYDLSSYRVGGKPGGGPSESRKTVDAALPLPLGKQPADVYFGAMELNGTGVHFYGDICLVLKAVDEQLLVLDRNSYDLIRSPIRDEIEVGPANCWPRRRAVKALGISGSWGASRDAIAALKVLGAVGFRDRRLTIGQISDAVRDDEDYIELLRIDSFGTKDLSEARLTASDVAREASIDGRRRTSPTPTLESLLWRQRRRIAERELRQDGVPVRIVATMGRIKG